MKTIKQILLVAAAVALAISCNQEKSPKVLVLYYSQGGNTKAVAEEIQTRLGADIEAIVPVLSYDGDFQATIERSRKEMDEGTWPEIQPVKSNIKSYDVIFLGYPIWFGTYAPPIETLIGTIDLSGKKVVPFCTFGSGGLDSSIKALKEKLPDTEILPGYGVRAARVAAIPDEIDRFLKEGGFIEGEVTKPEEFPAPHEVSEEESAILATAIGDYPMMQNAMAKTVTSRSITGGTEYLFTAASAPRDDMPAPPGGGEFKVYVTALDGQPPVFTQVVR